LESTAVELAEEYTKKITTFTGISRLRRFVSRRPQNTFLQITAGVLIQLDGFEKSLEIARSETLRKEFVFILLMLEKKICALPGGCYAE
jgi:hypothetical protein